MPHRTLTLEEVARCLNLTPAEVERLCNDREIPFETRGGRVVFRQRDIDAWASQRVLAFDPGRLAEYHRKTSQQSRARRRELLLPELMRSDGIGADLTAKTKASILRELVAVAARTGLVCSGPELIESLQEREKLCPTALPGGVAFLHPRQHHAYLFDSSFVVLGRTIQRIHFGAPDGQPTDLFFLICCQDDQLHLHTLARLCLMTQKTDVLERLRAAPDAGAMLECLLAAEQSVVTAMSAPGRKDRFRRTAEPAPPARDRGPTTDAAESGGLSSPPT